MVGVVNPPHQFTGIKLFIFLLQPLPHLFYGHLFNMIPDALYTPDDVSNLHADRDQKQDGIEQRQHDQEDSHVGNHQPN